MRFHPTKRTVVLIAVLSYVAVACVTSGPAVGELHRWWVGLGPVLPHDTFPADCNLCHAGQGWNVLTEDFEFDHQMETGVPLIGAHLRAQCLRCHNDRGPVAVFNAKGCVGCHEDFHYGDLGANCTSCHQENTWQPVGQIEMHNRTRFPLVGSHLTTACNRCHLGAFVGKFVPVATECVNCHTDDLANTTNPPHIPLNWVNNCQRCHMPTLWRHGVIN